MTTVKTASKEQFSKAHAKTLASHADLFYSLAMPRRLTCSQEYNLRLVGLTVLASYVASWWSSKLAWWNLTRSFCGLWGRADSTRPTS